MSDALTNYLTSSERHASISPETLERLGKEAANMYLDKGVSLNEAISKLAGAYDDINAEQIKRVVEFANTSVYLAIHEKNKTAGAASSSPHFPLADPNAVIQDLSDGARPTVVTKTDADYSKQPEKHKLSSAADGLLEQLFDAEGCEKRAGSDFTPETALTEVMDSRHMLKGLKEHLESSGEKIDLMHKSASSEYYDTVKRHLLDGNSFAEVLAAARSTGLEQQKIAAAMQPVVERLLREKVASPYQLKQEAQEFSKIAHRIVNAEHPLVLQFAAMVSLDAEIDKVASGIQDTEEQLSRVNSFIKENFGAHK